RKGLLHRAFSVFLTDGSHMLLHRRARNKYHSGGLWTNACCSHPRAGEQLTDSIHRRMREELGIDCPASELFHFTYFRKFQDDLYEYELDHVFLGHFSMNSSIPFQPEEIEEIRWIEFDELEQEIMDHPEHFTAWFITALPTVLEYIRTNPA
ncbi:MAG: NUDIX domain-containing protein, partial [Clostridiales bacterium]|nr:NUDIX domain-containing protein [Clostridiales bacterium]